MLETLRKINDILEPQERRRVLLLLAMMVVMGLLGAAGVASVMPFFAVVGNPSVVYENRYMSAVFEGLGFTSADSFLLYLGGTYVAIHMMVRRYLGHIGRERLHSNRGRRLPVSAAVQARARG